MSPRRGQLTRMVRRGAGRQNRAKVRDGNHRESSGRYPSTIISGVIIVVVGKKIFHKFSKRHDFTVFIFIPRVYNRSTKYNRGLHHTHPAP